MSIVEILDSEAISSTMESWIEECKKLRMWYLKAGTQEIDDVAIAKAYLKIEPTYIKKPKLN